MDRNAHTYPGLRGWRRCLAEPCWRDQDCRDAAVFNERTSGCQCGCGCYRKLSVCELLFVCGQSERQRAGGEAGRGRKWKARASLPVLGLLRCVLPPQRGEARAPRFTEHNHFSITANLQSHDFNDNLIGSVRFSHPWSHITCLVSTRSSLDLTS